LSPEELAKSPNGELLLPPGIFRFDQLRDQDFSKHKTIRELKKFLAAGEYPARFGDLITEAGYRKLLEKQQKDRREKDAKRKRDKRKAEKQGGNGR
jgi:hypothetical protein